MKEGIPWQSCWLCASTLSKPQEVPWYDWAAKACTTRQCDTEDRARTYCCLLRATDSGLEHDRDLYGPTKSRGNYGT